VWYSDGTADLIRFEKIESYSGSGKLTM